VLRSPHWQLQSLPPQQDLSLHSSPAPAAQQLLYQLADTPCCRLQQHCHAPPASLYIQQIQQPQVLLQLHLRQLWRCMLCLRQCRSQQLHWLRQQMQQLALPLLLLQAGGPTGAGLAVCAPAPASWLACHQG
jgi:hypothetical protein